MNTNEQSRSSINKMSISSGHADRVGARHREQTTAYRGGGYLDICTDFEVSEKKSRDPRIDELRDMGLSAFWRDLALSIGFESFIAVWMHLSNKASSPDEYNRICVPRYDRFIRYQRNRFVVSLSTQGVEPKDIQVRVKRELNEKISISHIYKLIRQNKHK